MKQHPKEGVVTGTGKAVKTKRTRGRAARYSKAANAAATIEGFGHDLDITFAFTNGQFSLLDLIEATLDITGPAHVLISTWSAGFYDVDRAERFRDNGKMLSVRFIMDSSDKRGQAKTGDIATMFGQDAIRTTRTHAKFVVIHNSEWNVVIQTSMNLNKNPRNEQFSMMDCEVTAGVILDIARALWDELPEGATYDRDLAYLKTVESVPAVRGVEMTETIRMGRKIEGVDR